jgi:cellulose 1,4-beta-cellobiosidase
VDGVTTVIDVSGMATASHTVTGLAAGKSHSFTIAAVAGSAESTQSTAVTATPTPPVPTGLSAAAGVAQVVLTWTASTNAGVTSYKIRQTVDGTETEIDVSGRATTTHTVTGLTIGKSYSFTIAAVAGSAESTQSTAVTATPTPPAVTGLMAVAGVEQVVLSWTASTTTGVTGYKIRQTVDDKGTRYGRRWTAPKQR